MTVCVKDVLYAIAIVPVVSPWGLYTFTYYKDNVTIYVKDVLYVIAIVPVVSPWGLYKFTYYKDNVTGICVKDVLYVIAKYCASRVPMGAL